MLRVKPGASPDDIHFGEHTCEAGVSHQDFLDAWARDAAVFPAYMQSMLRIAAECSIARARPPRLVHSILEIHAEASEASVALR